MLPITLQVSFFAFTPIANLAFLAFSCVDTGDGAEYMAADMSVQCREHNEAPPLSEYVAARRIAALAIVLYPLGLPILYGAMLFSQRRALFAGRKTALSRALSFLHQEYRPATYWWELVFISQKIVFVGFMNFVLPGSLTQLVVAIVVALCYIVAQMQASPFRHRGDNLVALSASIMLIGMLVLSTALKVTTVIEQVEALVSDETVELFSFHPVVAAAVMLTAIFASALLVVLMAVARASSAARREAREAARRRADASVIKELQEQLGEAMLPSQLAETKVGWDELEMGDQIGKGVWGDTHKAHQIVAQGESMPVAVKRLSKWLMKDAEAVAAFRQGCELMVCLHHPNIVACYGGAWSAHDANVCLVMELGGHGNLEQLLVREGIDLSWGVHKGDIAVGIARGLDHLHVHGHCHGALKPQEIIIDSAYHAKLSDVCATDFAVKRSTHNIHTQLYRAPELLAAMRYDWACDAWSFGCLLELLWTHRPVYSAHHALHDVDLIIEEVQAGTLRPALPPDSCLCELVVACAATDPDARPRLKDCVERLSDVDMARAFSVLPPGLADISSHRLPPQRHRSSEDEAMDEATVDPMVFRQSRSAEDEAMEEATMHNGGFGLRKSRSTEDEAMNEATMLAASPMVLTEQEKRAAVPHKLPPPTRPVPSYVPPLNELPRPLGIFLAEGAKPVEPATPRQPEAAVELSSSHCLRGADAAALADASEAAAARSTRKCSTPMPMAQRLPSEIKRNSAALPVASERSHIKQSNKEERITKRRQTLQAADDYADLHGSKDAPEGHLRHTQKFEEAHHSLVHELNDGSQSHAHHKFGAELKVKPGGGGLTRRSEASSGGGLTRRTEVEAARSSHGTSVDALAATSASSAAGDDGQPADGEPMMMKRVVKTLEREVTETFAVAPRAPPSQGTGDSHLEC